MPTRYSWAHLSHCSGNQASGDGLDFFGVVPGANVGIFTGPRMTDNMLRFYPVKEKVAFMQTSVC